MKRGSAGGRPRLSSNINGRRGWGWIKTGRGGGAKVRVGMKYFPVRECIALFARLGSASYRSGKLRNGYQPRGVPASDSTLSQNARGFSDAHLLHTVTSALLSKIAFPYFAVCKMYGKFQGKSADESLSTSYLSEHIFSLDYHIIANASSLKEAILYQIRPAAAEICWTVLECPVEHSCM